MPRLVDRPNLSLHTLNKNRAIKSWKRIVQLHQSILSINVSDDMSRKERTLEQCDQKFPHCELSFLKGQFHIITHNSLNISLDDCEPTKEGQKYPYNLYLPFLPNTPIWSKLAKNEFWGHFQNSLQVQKIKKNMYYGSIDLQTPP